MEFYHKNFDWPYIVKEIKENTVVVWIRKDNDWKEKEYLKERFKNLFAIGTWIKKTKENENTNY